MKRFKSRGKRVRASDKSLVAKYTVVSLLPVFLLVVFFMHCRSIIGFRWAQFRFSEINVPYWIFSLVVALAVCAVVGTLYRYFKVDAIRRVQHRQRLCRMILDNKWYEGETRKDQSWFKDMNTGQNSKEVITRFPRVYYRMESGLLHIHVEVVMSRYQEQLLKLEKKLESGLYCELTDKILHDGYAEYVLLYDTISRRIGIEDVVVSNGSMKLMETVDWAFDALPHMLISGGTGGGKTYFILSMIQALTRTDAKIHILDPKNADLADLASVMPDVYYKPDDILASIERFHDGMMERSEGMKTMPGYKTGENYAYLGLPPHFLIFDEYVAFMEMIGRKENETVLAQLKKIVMLGRQSGFFLVLACQRPDAKYLGDGIRDQFNFRVALGRMSELGYNMMFGETDKDFFQKPIRGRGYVDVGTSVISEFYTPLVPRGYDFLTEIGRAVNARSLSSPSRTGRMPVG